MIMIVGTTHDDILYFESIMSNKRSETLFNKYEITIGNFFNQDVLLLHNVYTSYISSALITHLIEKYFIILTFVVGKCTAYSKNLNIGDIVVSKHLYVADVDQTEEGDCKLGQIPNYPEKFSTPNDVIEYVSNGLESRTFTPHFVGNYISSNTSYYNEEQLKAFKAGDFLFGESTNVVFDSIGGGAAVACSIHNIPFVCVKVVSKKFGEKQTAKDYATVLKNFAGVGKAVVTCIGDIGRNDIIRGEGI